jgi:hypothetical protein
MTQRELKAKRRLATARDVRLSAGVSIQTFEKWRQRAAIPYPTATLGGGRRCYYTASEARAIVEFFSARKLIGGAA